MQGPTANRQPTLIILIWGFLLPQIVLALLNWHSWTLVAAEANDQELATAVGLWGLELGILFANCIAGWAYTSQKLELGWKVLIASLFMHTLYMLLVLFNVEAIIPNSIQRWILTEENVGRWNITLMMPAAFISLFALVRQYYSRIETKKRGLVTLAGIFGVPIVWYLVTTLLQPLWLGQYMVIVSIVVGTASVVIFLGAVIHLFDSLVHKHFFSHSDIKHYTVAGLLGIAAPLAGLTLNQSIPFPADFQSTGVYVLTVLNGLVLLIRPGFKHFSSAIFFLRCVTLPFIFYFFFVFLPFLPLSILAVLAVGLGFLMLTPLALGLFQMRVTFDAFARVKNRAGSTPALLLAVAGMLVLPSYFVAQAWMDKQALDSTLSYFYSHEIDNDSLAPEQAVRAAQTLVRMRDRKEDIQLPYISGFYNSVVFGDLVLSDQKIARMYRLLQNESLPDKASSLFPRQQRGARVWRGNLVAPTTEVDIDNLSQSATSPGNSTLKLVVRNRTDDTHSMYVGRLQIPQGVFITGLRLKIEGQWADGRIFDRKTALWVFQKITEVRRDPALLFYTSATQAELRVYPFPANGVRELEIDFSYHPAAQALVVLDNETLDLNPSASLPVVLSTDGNLVLSRRLSNYAWQRKPYLHFILDFSLGATASVDDSLANIARIGKQLGVSQLRLTAANLGVSKSSKLLEIEDSGQIRKYIEDVDLEKFAGLWVQQAIAKEIVRANKALGYETLGRYPVFVVLGGSYVSTQNIAGVEIESARLSSWGGLIPDSRYWYSDFGLGLNKHCLQDNCLESEMVAEQEPKIVVLKSGTEIRVLPSSISSMVPAMSAGSIQVYDPSTKAFEEITSVQSSEGTNPLWPTAAQAWSRWRASSRNPAALEAQRSDWLSTSRDLGLLLPVTSYIVVESPSQWEILKRKEKQSIANHSGFDFEEEQQTPEPAWWLLLGLLLAYLYVKERPAESRNASVTPDGKGVSRPAES